MQRDGVRLDYRLNGLAALIATTLLYPAAVSVGLLDLARVEAEARAFVTLFQLAAFIVSALLVVRARLANVGERRFASVYARARSCSHHSNTYIVRSFSLSLSC